MVPKVVMKEGMPVPVTIRPLMSPNREDAGYSKDGADREVELASNHEHGHPHHDDARDAGKSEDVCQGKACQKIVRRDGKEDKERQKADERHYLGKVGQTEAQPTGNGCLCLQDPSSL
jgi:hypothetical protein